MPDLCVGNDTRIREDKWGRVSVQNLSPLHLQMPGRIDPEIPPVPRLRDGRVGGYHNVSAGRAPDYQVPLHIDVPQEREHPRVVDANDNPRLDGEGNSRPDGHPRVDEIRAVRDDPGVVEVEEAVHDRADGGP